MLTRMQDWQLPKDSRFALQFRFPPTTSQGYPVDKTESQHDEGVRVHFFSRDSQELYFEVTRYYALRAQVEYEPHKVDLEKRLDEIRITDLEQITWKSLPAYEYSFVWNQGARSVLFVQRNGSTYRILYDPRSLLNIQVLSTLEWTD